jgi:2-C-methyl-D-erythritol 4-phosphate cytidylyltransferase
MAVALIVAAGRGERLGAGKPKALIEVAGRSMLDRCLDAIRQVEAIVAVVVALPPECLDVAPAGVIAVAGGESRSESVRLALAAAPDDEIVLVHDAARALTEPALFTAAIGALERSGADAVVAATPVTDTVKEVAVKDAGAAAPVVERTLERSRLWAVQTPQVFRRAALARALSAPAEVLAAATDDASLVERQGGTVRIVPAPRENLKITTPLDLQLAELLLARRCPAGAGVGTEAPR